MPWLGSEIIRPFLILSFVGTTCAVPVITYPIYAQLPPVARISKEYEFVFSQSTFTSSAPIEYRLEGAPQWLNIDGSKRLLHGKPSPHDDGIIDFRVDASDGNGSIQHNVTLVVSNKEQLTVTKNLYSVLSGFGQHDGRGGLVMLPNQDFQFSFPADIFSPQRSVKSFEALSTDNTPLPSWVKFDRSTRQFAGRTPGLASLTAPPQHFGLQLIGTDFPGFKAVSIGFDIIVGAKTFHFKESYTKAIALPGKRFSYKIPLQSILRDGQPITVDSLGAVSANTTGWLTFNETDAELHGTPPSNVKPASVVAVVKDQDGEEAHQLIDIMTTSKLIAKVEDFEVERGKHFSYYLSHAAFSATNVAITASAPKEVGWITFNETTSRLEGTVPEGARGDIPITVQVRSGEISEVQTFRLVVSDAVKDDSRVSGDPGNPELGRVSKSSKRTIAIILGVLLPILFIAGAIYLWLVFGKRYERKGRPPTPGTVVISRPMEQTPEPWPITSAASGEKRAPSPEGSGLSEFVFGSTRAVPQPPRVVPSSAGSTSESRFVSLEEPRNDSPTITITAPQQSMGIPAAERSQSPTYTINRSDSLREHRRQTRNFSRKEGYLRRSGSQRSASEGEVSFSVVRRSSDRVTKRYSTVPNVAVRRMSGIGHGKEIGPPGHGTPQRSWRRTMSITNGLQRESADTAETMLTEMLFNSATVRLVSGSDNESVLVKNESPKPPSPYSSHMRTPWKRTSKAPSLSVTPAEPFGYQDSLVDEVMSALSRDGHVSAITAPSMYSRYSREPNVPLQQADPNRQSIYDPKSRPTSRFLETRSDDAIVQVTDENGAKVWYHPRHSNGSDLTRFTRATNTSMPYEPFEYGVALTSSWVEGPGAGGAYDDRSLMELQDGKRQRTKLVDFTRKRPISITEPREARPRDSSCSADVAFL